MNDLSSRLEDLSPMEEKGDYAAKSPEQQKALKEGGIPTPEDGAGIEQTDAQDQLSEKLIPENHENVSQGETRSLADEPVELQDQRILEQPAEENPVAQDEEFKSSAEDIVASQPEGVAPETADPVNDSPSGPEDQAFDANKDKRLRDDGYRTYPEEEFERKGSGWQSRPDGVADSGKEKIYFEDKRPIEIEKNSWLSTYEKDPIKEKRTEARVAYDNGEISRERAQVKTHVAENDDHYEKKGKAWDDPLALEQHGQEEKLGIRYPDDPKGQVLGDAAVDELKEQGRNPVLSRENGIVEITYDTLK